MRPFHGVIAIAFFLSTTLAFSENLPEQTIHFPADSSVGEVGLKESSVEKECWWKWSFSPPAKGDVVIPAGKLWALRLDRMIMDDPALLDNMPLDEIEVLDIGGWRSDDLNEFIPYLVRFTNLRCLLLGGTDSLDFGPLVNMPQLVDLVTISKQLREPGFAQIGRLKQVQRLKAATLRGFSKAVLESLSGLDNLRYLSICSKTIDNAGIATLARLKKLEFLGLTGFDPLTTEGYVSLTKLASLKELNLGSIALTPEGLAELARHPRLERLSMMGVSDEHLIPLKSMPSLRWLKLEARRNDQRSNPLCDTIISESGETRQNGPNQFTEIGFAALAEMKNLETLDIEAGGPTSDESLKSLASLSKLKVLSMLNREDVTDSQMAYFAQMTALEELGIRGSQITDEGLAKLSGLRSLKKLCLFPDSKVTAIGIARLKQAIPGLEVKD